MRCRQAPQEEPTNPGCEPGPCSNTSCNLTCCTGRRKAASPARFGRLRFCLVTQSQISSSQCASLRRLEELNEARQEQLARVKLVEREREGLEGDKQQAEAYLQKEQECLRAQSTIFLKFIWTAQVGEKEHAGSHSGVKPACTRAEVSAHRRAERHLCETHLYGSGGRRTCRESPGSGLSDCPQWWREMRRSRQHGALASNVERPASLAARPSAVSTASLAADWPSVACDVQRNLAKSEASVTELEAKLRHEQEKFQSYGEDLKQAEARCLARFCCPSVGKIVLLLNSLALILCDALCCPAEAFWATWCRNETVQGPLVAGHCQPLLDLSLLGCRPTTSLAVLLRMQGQAMVCRVHTGRSQAGCRQLEQSAMHMSLSEPLLRLQDPNNACTAHAGGRGAVRQTIVLSARLLNL